MRLGASGYRSIPKDFKQEGKWLGGNEEKHSRCTWQGLQKLASALDRQWITMLLHVPFGTSVVLPVWESRSDSKHMDVIKNFLHLLPSIVLLLYRK